MLLTIKSKKFKKEIELSDKEYIILYNAIHHNRGIINLLGKTALIYSLFNKKTFNHQ